MTARTSAFAFRGKEQDIRRIAEALNVRTILQGSVRRSGKRIRDSCFENTVRGAKLPYCPFLFEPQSFANRLANQFPIAYLTKSLSAKLGPDGGCHFGSRLNIESASPNISQTAAMLAVIWLFPRPGLPAMIVNFPRAIRPGQSQ